MGIHRGMTPPGQDGDPSRFAIMFEVNSWSSQAEVEKVILYRGAIITAWSQIETQLSEWALCASHAEAYRKIQEQFPYKMAKRLSFVEKVLNAPGPLEHFAPMGILLLKRVEAGMELRNQMAHARMRVLPSGINFEELVGKGAQVTWRYKRYSFAQLGLRDDLGSGLITATR